MKKFVAGIAFVLFSVVFAFAADSNPRIDSSGFHKGDIDVELLSRLLSNKQERLKRQFMLRFVANLSDVNVTQSYLLHPFLESLFESSNTNEISDAFLDYLARLLLVQTMISNVTGVDAVVNKANELENKKIDTMRHLYDSVCYENLRTHSKTSSNIDDTVIQLALKNEVCPKGNSCLQSDLRYLYKTYVIGKKKPDLIQKPYDFKYSIRQDITLYVLLSTKKFADVLKTASNSPWSNENWRTRILNKWGVDSIALEDAIKDFDSKWIPGGDVGEISTIIKNLKDVQDIDSNHLLQEISQISLAASAAKNPSTVALLSDLYTLLNSKASKSDLDSNLHQKFIPELRALAMQDPNYLSLYKFALDQLKQNMLAVAGAQPIDPLVDFALTYSTRTKSQNYLKIVSMLESNDSLFSSLFPQRQMREFIQLAIQNTQADTTKDMISMNVASLLVDAEKKWYSRVRSPWSPILDIGFNTTLYRYSSKGSQKHPSFASEKVGLSYALWRDHSEAIDSMEIDPMALYQANVLDKVAIDLFTSGLLYNIAPLKNDDDFQDVLVEIGPALYYKIGLVVRISGGIAVAPDGAKRFIAQVGLDIPLAEYLGELAKPSN